MTEGEDTAARDALRAIWDRRAEEVEERVRILEEVALALMQEALSESLHERGIQAAHKLAGTLGTFGMSRGSVLAEEAEQLLGGGGEAPAPAAAVRLSEIVLGLDESLAAGPAGGAEPPAEKPEPMEGAQGPEGDASDEPGGRFGRVGIDGGVPESVRSVLEAEGVRLPEIDVDDQNTDPSTHADVLVLGVEEQDDGYERCRAVRRRCPATPIIACLPRHDPESIERVFAAGASDFVALPVVGPEVLARVLGHLERLRLRAALPAGAVTPHDAAEPIADRHVDVVVVEDDAALSDLLDHTLRTRGYSTERFVDGAVALESLVGDPPAVAGRAIILDVNLPGVDGLAVLRELRREGVLRRTRVLMLTARSRESEVLQALQIGAVDHVSKPFSVPELMHRLQRALMS